jgi:four helix bundle protein
MATGLENLKIYKMAEDLEVKVHEITKKFPKDERYRSIDQLRRSSSSVSNNIAEGYARYSYKEKVRFLYIAKGEAEETKRNILRSARKELLPETLAKEVADEYTSLLKGISGYIGFVKKQDGNSS